MTERFRDLESRLGVHLAQQDLLRLALTHRSKGARNYERLEFLGDSILGFVVAAQLYERYPKLSEGELTRLRATLVRKETLAEVARQIDLGNQLILGSGELHSGGFDRDSILADALEAVIGAVYLDQGIGAVESMILHLFTSRLSDLDPGSVQKDPKTRLQEYLQKHSMRTPDYEVQSIKGVAHDQTFIVNCQVPGVDQTFTGEGRSRRKAEQDAASRALAWLMS